MNHVESLGYPSAELVKQTVTAVHFGDARKAGLTARTDSLEERTDKLDKAQASADKKLNTILVLLITLLGGVVTELIKK
jgi:hypothetical protein